MTLAALVAAGRTWPDDECDLLIWSMLEDSGDRYWRARVTHRSGARGSFRSRKPDVAVGVALEVAHRRHRLVRVLVDVLGMTEEEARESARPVRRVRPAIA